MSSKSRITKMLTAFVLIAATHTHAAVPQLISFQGRLTDSADSPIDGVFDIVHFTIYDAETGGNVVWTEEQTTLIVAEGLFNVLLGSATPLHDSVFGGPDRYLAVSLDGGLSDLSPRTRLVSVPFAFRSAHSDRSMNFLKDTSSMLITSDNTSTHLFSFSANMVANFVRVYCLIDAPAVSPSTFVSFRLEIEGASIDFSSADTVATTILLQSVGMRLGSTSEWSFYRPDSDRGTILEFDATIDISAKAELVIGMGTYSATVRQVFVEFD